MLHLMEGLGDDMTEDKKKIKVKVFRFNPRQDKEPSYDTFEVPLSKHMTVLTVLNYIYENLDSSLAYNYSCKEGLCHACALIVNGEACEACSTLVKGEITIEPPSGFEVIKDLIASDVLVSNRDLLLSARQHSVERVYDRCEELFEKLLRKLNRGGIE